MKLLNMHNYLAAKLYSELNLKMTLIDFSKKSHNLWLSDKFLRNLIYEIKKQLFEYEYYI